MAAMKRGFAKNYNSPDPGLIDRIEKRKKLQLSPDDHATLKEWSEAKSYEDLLDLNRAFLRGDREICAYHMGPLYFETMPSLPTLLRLHDFGILTTNSQPSKVSGPEYDQCSCCPKVSWFWTKQRAFLSFLIPTDDNRIPLAIQNNFIKELMFDSNFFTSIYNGMEVTGNFPEGWVTHASKKADSEAELEGNPKVTHRRIIKLDDDSEIKTNAMREAGPLLIHVLARNWEEADLVGLVEQAAKRAGMQPVYAA